MNDFVLNMSAIQSRARENLDQGPLTEAYGADRERVVEILNDALATELVCVLRYRSHHFLATGLAAKSVAEDFSNTQKKSKSTRIESLPASCSCKASRT